MVCEVFGRLRTQRRLLRRHRRQDLPTRIRSFCMSFCMSFCFFVNWIVDYGITKATPVMLTEMGWGTFLLYAG